MTDAYCLHQNGDMDGAGQKGFLIRVGLCLTCTLSRLCPSIPSSSPLKLWDSIYLLHCSGHTHLQDNWLLPSSPCQWLVPVTWIKDSGELYWWLWQLCRACTNPGFCLSGGGGGSVEAKLQTSSHWKWNPKQLTFYIPKAVAWEPFHGHVLKCRFLPTWLSKWASGGDTSWIPLSNSTWWIQRSFRQGLAQSPIQWSFWLLEPLSTPTVVSAEGTLLNQTDVVPEAYELYHQVMNNWKGGDHERKQG